MPICALQPRIDPLLRRARQGDQVDEVYKAERTIPVSAYAMCLVCARQTR